MRFYTSMIFLLLLSVGITIKSFPVEHQTAKAYAALNGQVSDAGEKDPIHVRGRR
ncbi:MULTISPECIES: hypothetical protein [Planktothricoides]|uniref:Uncharacterized protein n=2 Tax=Planktothricoides raciborskii TaxID=132608 RepID=A0AAU8JH06_9CYAN|nr:MULTISPECIES: hypothetical protein [Planktothricoides]MBD2545214.1 hypothetical protein [Planktothricoides raciborskii FACHB-1370]MBD2583257.1 hypothetical protein [Planktothricoides raciborskii FACHB-1261]